MLDKYRKFFDSESSYGWFVPLVVPAMLWYLSVNDALRFEGLLGESKERAQVVAQVSKHAEKIDQFPGEPIINIYEDRNANKELRLVVRTMGSKDDVGNPKGSFVFSGLVALLLIPWGASIALKLVALKLAASPPNSGSASPPNSGSASPPNSGSASPPNSGSASPPNSGSASPPNSGSASPPNSGSAAPPKSEEQVAKWRKILDEVLLVLNSLAVVYYVGIQKALGQFLG